MAAWCLPRAFVSKFEAALKDGTINVTDPAAKNYLPDMGSPERRALFGPIVGEENVSRVNALFESKLLLKDQQRGIITWIKSMQGLPPKAAQDMIARVSRMSKVLQPADEDSFLQDLASQRLKTGGLVQADEAQKIYDLSKAAMDARAVPTTNISGVSDEYLNASREFHDYIGGLKPTTPGASIGKNAMAVARNIILSNPSTPIKTAIGDIVNGTMESVVRRLGTGQFRGANPALASAAKKEAWGTYIKTGQNIASMEGVDDFGRLGEGRRFDLQTGADSGNAVTQAVERGVRKIAAFTNKIVIDYAHVAPFTRFYQGAFYDMTDLMSSKLAAGDATRASEILKDASRIEPLTDEGKIVRSAAQASAARVTSTNDTLMGGFALNAKDWLNRRIAGLGDAIMPVAKIPANVIWNGIENAGPGIPLGIKDVLAGRQKMQSLDEATRYQGMAQFAGGMQKTLRTVGTLAGAAFFASLLTPDDFRNDKFGASYLKLGGLWVNMEYIAAISPALAGMMMAKRDQTGTFAGQVGGYLHGSLAALKEAPGIKEIPDLLDQISKADVYKGALKYAEDFVRSRTVPPILENLLFKDRPGNRILFGAHGVESPLQVSEDAWPKGRLGLTPWGDAEQGMPHAEADPTNQVLFGLGIHPGFPAKTINGVSLTDDQYKEYIQMRGQQAKSLLDISAQDPNWMQMSKTDQIKDVRKVIRKATKDAAIAIQNEYPDIINKSQAKKDAENGMEPNGAP